MLVSNPAPFLKWAGGKGQLLRQYAPLIPRHERYFEPFLGGGAMFFSLCPSSAVLSDSNPRLIATYRVVRDDLDALLPWLARFREAHSETSYYAVRARYNEGAGTVAERAAMFIYLNKTGFNGLYRVNARGGFNVPYGRYRNPSVFDVDVLGRASAALQRADLRHGDFADALRDAARGDFVYLDPPYHPLSATASFTSYTSDAFDETQQERLAALYRDLDGRGCRVMLSNSDTPLVRKLYRGFRRRAVSASRSINCVASGRGPVREYVILNY
jgi:DNA adenine methylase